MPLELQKKKKQKNQLSPTIQKGNDLHGPNCPFEEKIIKIKKEYKLKK